ncbi:MAG: dihydrodipicolinate synthase family protein [Chloroflexi bacterium]|nr:dihydrodipicolinate synthase family protein [Chloroflexota bacterium]
MAVKYRKSEAKAYAREHMKGLWAAITIPFKEDLSLDEEGLRRNLRYFADELHIDGVFTGGMLGEVWALTKEERKRQLEIVVDECRGKMQVIAHTGHSSALEAVEMTLHAQEVGADYAIMQNPYMVVRNEDHCMAFFEYVCERTQIGISMFNTGLGGYVLPPALVARLAEIENMIAIKDAQPMSHVNEVRRLCGDSIVVMDPMEEHWAVSKSVYNQQAMNSEPTIYLFQTAERQPVLEYTKLLDDGKLSEALVAHHALWPLRDVYKFWIGGPWERAGLVNIQAVKAWMDMQGLAGGPVRPPLRNLTDGQKAQLRGEIEATGLQNLKQLAGARG